MDLKAKLRLAVMSFKGYPSDHATTTGISNAIFRCTDRHDVSSNDKYVHEILFHVTNSPTSATFLARRICHRLKTTRDEVVAVKTLLLLHRLLRGGDRHFEIDMCNLFSSGDLCLDLHMHRSKVHTYPSSFLNYYSMFMEERLRWGINQSGNLEPISATSTTQRSCEEEHMESSLRRLARSLVFFERLVNYRPTNISQTDLVVQSTMNIVLRESFRVYEGLFDGVATLLTYFSGMNNRIRRSSLKILKEIMLQGPKLGEFYDSCKLTIVSSKKLEYPQIRIITEDEIFSLEKKNPVERESDNGERKSTLFSKDKLQTKICTQWVEFEEDSAQSGCFNVRLEECSSDSSSDRALFEF